MARSDTGGPVRVLCWSERTEREDVYPQGINGAVADALSAAGGFEVRCANLADEGQGLGDDLLAWADALYKLHRGSVKAELRTAKILERLEIQDVTDEEIDAVLDAE